MAALLRALGFDSKPEYLEKIPESLSPAEFDVQNTFHHGFPSNPTCLAYDPVQQLLVIGTESGCMLLLGKPGLERYLTHPQRSIILQMVVITNKGLLVTCCDNRSLYLWCLTDKEPYICHTLTFEREKPTAISWTYGSEYLYAGTDTGNVHVVRVSDFSLSGYTIYWNYCVPLGQRTKPGAVLSVLEHPMDQGKVLVAFTVGSCVLWNLKTKALEKLYKYEPGDNHILTSVCWLGIGKQFGCAYSDGTIVLWNPKCESRPEKIICIHDTEPGAFNKPIYKLQLVLTDSEPWYFCSGGFPEDSPAAPQTLTISHSRSSSLLTSTSTIIDFLCLPSSPFATDPQKPFALVILAKEELIVHDLETPGFPPFPIPYALDLHSPPVTCVACYGNCSDEFIASLHSVKSKTIHYHKSTKQWPLMGGKWGEESPHLSSDLIVTGHLDGSVRLWCASSVILQPFFTLNTGQHFKMRFSAPPPAQATPPVQATPPTKALSPVQAPPPSQARPMQLQWAAAEQTPANGSSPRVPPPRPPLPVIKTVGTEIQPQQDKEGRGKVGVASDNTKGDRSSSGQTGGSDGAAQSESTDGVTHLSESAAHQGERRQVYPKRKKSMFQRNRVPKISTSKAPASLAGTPLPEADSGKPTKVKSFRKKKPDVKRDGGSKVEVDMGDVLNMGEATVLPDKSATPTGSMATAPSNTLPVPGTVNVAGHANRTNDTTAMKPKVKPQQPPEFSLGGTATQTSVSAQVSPTASSVLPLREEEVVPINQLHLCPWGRWLCVSNTGGNALAFCFELSSAGDRAPSSLDVDFSADSIMHPSGLKKGGASSGPAPSPRWVFNEGRVAEPQPGFHLVQHCQCYCSENEAEHLPPVALSAMQFSVRLELLVLGSNRGVAVVDTVRNQCICTLSSITSILYMSDPSKFGRQVRREVSSSKLPVATKPTIIKRHSTLLAINPHVGRCFETRVPVPTDIDATPSAQSCEDGAVLEMEGSVVAMELVHLQLDSKQAKPTLTLWVGTAGGRVVAYSVSTVAGAGADKTKTQRRVELLPTGIISEHKSPIVDLLFLNEWGDRQVVPFKRQRCRSNSCSSSSSSAGSIPPSEHTQRPPSSAVQRAPGQNYAVFVDELKIRSFAFPGNILINKVAPPMDGVIIKCNYFRCKDMPCLFSVTSCQHLLVHSLPGLKPLTTTAFPPLRDPRVTASISVYGDGQGLYLNTPSEIQRVSVTKGNWLRLNLPQCLPSLHLQTPDPQPNKGGLFGTGLFGTNPTEINRTDIFGDSAGRPWSTVAKRDGQPASAVPRRQRPGDSKQKAGTLAGQMNDNVTALQRRKEQLTEIEEKAQEMDDHANDFASLAQRLADKYK